MAIARRIERLEERMGGRGLCPHGSRVVYPLEDGRPPSGPEICPVCDLPRIVFSVVYESRPPKGMGL